MISPYTNATDSLDICSNSIDAHGGNLILWNVSSGRKVALAHGDGFVTEKLELSATGFTVKSTETGNYTVSTWGTPDEHRQAARFCPLSSVCDSDQCFHDLRALLYAA